MSTPTQARLAAHAVATPLLSFLDLAAPLGASVLGSSSTSAYLLTGGFVIAVTARSVPLMPNGLGLIQSRGLDFFRAGARAQVTGDEIKSDGVVVALALAEVCETGVARNHSFRSEDVARRGSDLCGALEFDASADLGEALARVRPELAAADGVRGARALIDSLQRRDPGPAAEASLELVGRGQGLTPDGDDLLAATAAAIIAFERPAGLGGETASSLRAAMLPVDLRRRTSSLSATLLHLAVEGHVIEPVRSILDLSAGEQSWGRALERLQRIGHGTGRTYALGCALAALSLSQPIPAVDQTNDEERNFT